METPRVLSRLILRWLLVAGAFYFLLVAAAHQFGIKVAGLYVYWNVVSFEYQDLIISGLAFGWAMFFALGAILVATGSVVLVGLHVGAGLVAIVSLVRANLTGELNGLADGLIRPYWVQVGALGCYLLLVTFFYAAAVRQRRTTSAR